MSPKRTPPGPDARSQAARPRFAARGVARRPARRGTPPDGARVGTRARRDALPAGGRRGVSTSTSAGSPRRSNGSNTISSSSSTPEPTQGCEVLPIASLAYGQPEQAGGTDAWFSRDPRFHVRGVSGAPRRDTLGRRASGDRASGSWTTFEAARRSASSSCYQALAGCLPIPRDSGPSREHPPSVLLHRDGAPCGNALLSRPARARSFDEIPDYDHRAPGPVFETLRKLIFELSDPLFVERYRRIPMERETDLFRTSVPADVKKPGARVFLKWTRRIRRRSSGCSSCRPR